MDAYSGETPDIEGEIKCEHEPCTCMVDEDDQYCSRDCESAAGADTPGTECDCAHSACESTAVSSQTA